MIASALSISVLASARFELVEGEFGQQDVRSGLVRIDRQRLSGELAGQRRIVGRHRARHPQQRRRMLCVGAQRRFERPGRFPPLVLLEEQLAPRHVGHDVGRGPRDRFAEEVVRLLKAAEGPRGAAGADVVGRRRADDVTRQDEGERAHRLGAASLEAAEEPQLHSGVADRALGDRGLQHLFGLGVLADRRVGPRPEDRRGGIGAQRRRQRMHLVVAPGQQRPLDRGTARRRLCRHDGGAGAQPGEQRGDHAAHGETTTGEKGGCAHYYWYWAQYTAGFHVIVQTERSADWPAGTTSPQVRRAAAR